MIVGLLLVVPVPTVSATLIFDRAFRFIRADTYVSTGVEGLGAEVIDGATQFKRVATVRSEALLRRSD